MNMEIKKELYQKCMDYLDQKIANETKLIESAQESANGDTKSSAGDKYETHRAMMHLEKEKFSRQLAGSLALKKQLAQIDVLQKYDSVTAGALVITNIENFFFAISADEIEIDDEEYIPLSLASPIGKEFLGKKKGECVTFRGTTYSIAAVL